MFLLKWFKFVPPGPPKTEDSSQTSIMDMPDLVMRKILKDVDLWSMLNLRKVCRAFQNFIDNTNQIKLDLDSILVTPGVDEIRLTLIISGKYKIVKFQKSTSLSRCTVTTVGSYCNTTWEMTGITMLEALWTCLDGLLKNQKTPLKQFVFDYSASRFVLRNSETGTLLGCCKIRKHNSYSLEYDYKSSERNHSKTLDIVEQVLSSQKLPIQITSLSMKIFEFNQAQKLLAIVDQEGLRYLNIEYVGNDSIFEEIDLDKVMEYCPMVNVKQLMISGAIITSSLHSILHIPNLVINKKKLSVEELLLLRRAFLSSPDSNWTEIHYDYLLEDCDEEHQKIVSALGPSSIHTDHVITWFFGFPKQNKCLQLRVTRKLVYFASIDRADVHQKIFDLMD